MLSLIEVQWTEHVHLRLPKTRITGSRVPMAVQAARKSSDLAARASGVRTSQLQAQGSGSRQPGTACASRTDVALTAEALC